MENDASKYTPIEVLIYIEKGTGKREKYLKIDDAIRHLKHCQQSIPEDCQETQLFMHEVIKTFIELKNSR